MKTICSMKILSRTLLGAALVLLGCNAVRAQSIYVPNPYFSLPVVTDYTIDVATNMICWEASPQDNYGAIGVFGNFPGDGGDYILNCDGPQAAYIFEDSGLALFLDYDAVDSAGSSNTFTATFVVGQSYQLQAGFVVGTEYGYMEPGSILQMSLYYRDDDGNMQTVAFTNIVNDTNVFTSDTSFLQYELSIPAVQASDPWAGRHIGIEFQPQPLSSQDQGGFWDIGNVQLWNIPCLLNPTLSNGQFGATLLSQPGQIFQILATTNFALPRSNWSSVVTVTNNSGTASFVDPTPSPQQRFYQARQVLPPPPPS
jgi:hypothetical protein